MGIMRSIGRTVRAYTLFKDSRLLAAGLSGRENVKLMLVSGKGHNPNYTADAVAYLGEYLAAKNKLAKKKKLGTEAEKKGFLASWDWGRMTAQDESVWGEILAWLE